MQPHFSSPAGIYLHIPFCRAKCPYCDFFSSTDMRRLPDFLTALERELRLRTTDSLKFDSIYLGGGTPSLLEGAAVARLLALVHDCFEILPDTEITLEANPGSIDPRGLAAFRRAGVNRLNIGVQSFQDPNLRLLGRRHDAAAAAAAIRQARAAGFTNLGLDLIYGLPGQEPDHWRADLEAALSFTPEHLSCYLLTFEPGTRFDLRRRRGQLQPLGDAAQAELVTHTRRFLAEHGYPAYEISNFARRPRKGEGDLRSRHNRKYWDHTAYLGFGPAAHSYVHPERSWNTQRLGRYIDRLAAGRRPLEERERLTDHELRIETLYLSLRQTRGLDSRAYGRKFGEDFAALFKPQLEALVADGLVAWSPPYCRLTEKGVPLADGVVAHLLGALPAAQRSST